LDGNHYDAKEAASLSHKWNHIHIYSNSWGPHDDGATFDGPGKLTTEALKKGKIVIGCNERW